MIAAMIPTLKLFLLGRPHVHCGEIEAADFITTKVEALLYFLAVTRQTHERTYLAELLWGEEPPDKARNSLRNALSHLNKSFPHHVEISRETVRFRSESPHWLDVEPLARQAQTPLALDEEVSAGQAALALYRGDFLAEFFVDGAPAFEDWMLAQRAHWRQCMLDALQTAASMLVKARAYQDAMAVVDRLLALEPWDEEAHMRLMEVYSRVGDFNMALAQYEKCRTVLATELDVEPMPETTALYERIQLARQGRTHNLPADSTPFIGRHTELAQIHNLLTNPDVRLVSIVGLGGIGKTRLALEAARQAAQEQALIFLNGVCFVPLAGLQTPDGIPSAIFDGLDVSPTGSRALVSQLLDYLSNKELLLLLDNFEHLQTGTPLLRRILDGCPDVKLLVTGREPLNLAEEWRLDLEGLSYPPQTDENAESLSAVQSTQWEAVRLFVQMAQQMQPTFLRQKEELPHVVRLCQIVAGMPLALRLAASWLRTMTVARIVSELAANLDLLTTQMRDLPPRQRSMRIVFDYTWGLLHEGQRQVMAKLTVFRGGLCEEAALQVAGATPTVLADLVDRWLLQFSMTPTGGRYTIHELTRQYAAEQLSDAAAVQREHGHYFASFVQQQYEVYLRGHYRHVIANLLAEIDNIRTTWRRFVQWVAEGQEAAFALEELVCLAHPWTWFLRQRALYVEGKEIFGAAIDALSNALDRTEPTDALYGLLQQTQARLQIRQALFCYFTGEYERVDALIAAALPVVQAAGLHAEEATALEILARPTRRRGDYAATKALAQRSSELFQRAGSDLGKIQALAHLSTTAADEGDYALAVETGQQILAFYRTLNDTMGVAQWLTNVANTYLRWDREGPTAPRRGLRAGPSGQQSLLAYVYVQ